LQVCPTNIDPAYDRPPGDTYVCAICSARGEHFNSLCPKNTDPYCLTQKRKRAGILAAPTGPKKENIVLTKERWERDEDTGKAGKENHKLIIPHRQIKRERKENTVEKRILGKRIKIPERDGWPGDMVSREERLDRNIQNEPICRPTFETSSSVDSIKEAQCDNIQRLVRRYGPVMTEVVNPVRDRPTALDLWKQDDDIHHQRIDATWVLIGCISWLPLLILE